MPFGIFKESQHPRGKGGQFTKKGSGSSAKDPSIGGVRKSDFDKQRLYADPSKPGWEKRAVKNTTKIANARAKAMQRIMKDPKALSNGKYDWLWAQGTANTDPRGNAQPKNVPSQKKPVQPRTGASQGKRTNTQPKREKPLQSNVEPKIDKIKQQQEQVKQLHRQAGLQAAKQAHKPNKSKAKWDKLLKQQQAYGRQAKALKAKQLQEKAKQAPKQNSIKAQKATVSAQRKAVQAKITAEKGKRHPNERKIASLQKQNAKLTKKSQKINKKANQSARSLWQKRGGFFNKLKGR